MVLTRVPHTKALSHSLWARQHSPHHLSPLSLPGLHSLPHSLPICLWASDTAGFCGYIFLPLSSMASSGQHLLQAKWVFPSLCWEGPKGSHRRLGTASSRKARQLQSLKYKPSICAFTELDLLHFYWAFTEISEEV